jgi:hypothetical protein
MSARSHSHHHHRTGFRAHMHRDKIRRRWLIRGLLAAGIVVPAVLIYLNLARV